MPDTTTLSCVRDTPPDPFKRVRYALGMVLGVDDFDQEYAYLDGRDQRIARDLIGYGTVRGLRVSLGTGRNERGESEVEVVVDPGLALSPRGEWIRVAQAQCALLETWMANHQTELAALIASLPPAPLFPTVPVWVVLSYREVATDRVPIPIEACTSEDAASDYSRYRDEFRLELTLTRPEQTELDAAEELARWIAAIPTSTTATTTEAQFVAAMRAAFTTAAAPPYLTAPSPAVHPDALERFVQVAVRVYVTELRANAVPSTPPAPSATSWLGIEQTANGAPPREGRIALARLDVPFTSPSGSTRIVVDPTHPIEIREEGRPLVAPSLLTTPLLRHALRGGTATPSPTRAVVAAGVAKLTSPPGAPTAGSIGTWLAIATADGELTVRFEPPTWDDGSAIYIPQVSLVPSAGPGVVAPIATLLDSTPRALPAAPLSANARAFRYRVTDGGTNVPVASMTSLNVVLDLSAYR